MISCWALPPYCCSHQHPSWPPPLPLAQKKNETRQIYGKYLRPGPIQLEFITEQLVQDMRACIEQALEDKSILGPDLFLELQKLCFRQIFEKTFMPLKTEHPER